MRAAVEDTRLGALLLEHGVVPERDLQRCLELQALTGGAQPLGRILVEQGLISERTLEDLLALQEVRRERGHVEPLPEDGDSTRFLAAAVQAGATELHLSEGRPPVVRVAGQLLPLIEDPLPGPAVWQFVREHMGYDVPERLAQPRGALTRGFVVEHVARGRMTAFRHFDGMGVAVRIHPAKVRDVGDLDAAVVEAVHRPRGLLLLTGEQGSGVTETFAALLHEAARGEQRSIVVLDEQFEYPRPDGDAIVVMRAVGQDTADWTTGLRAGLREEHDALFVAGITAEAFDVALHAAESRCLVVLAVRGGSAVEALTRVLRAYPRYDSARVRATLASVLLGVLAVRLVPAADGLHHELATEVLHRTEAVRDLIRGGALRRLDSLLRSEDGGHGLDLDTHLIRLVRAGRARLEDVFGFAKDKSRLLAASAE